MRVISNNLQGLLVPNPPSRLTSGEARQLLRQVDVLGRLEGCALQAASFNFGLPLRPRPFYGDSVLRREEAPEKEKGELTRLLKRIEPDMADFLDSLVFGAKPGKVTYGEALSRARDRMAILWPALRDIHLRVTGRECAPPGPALLGSHLRAAGGEHAPPAGAAVVA